VRNQKVRTRLVFARFFIHINTLTLRFTFHDNGDGTTFVSAETTLNCNRRGQASEHLPQNGDRSVICGMSEWAKKD